MPLKDLNDPYEPKSVSAKGLYVKAHVAGYTFNEKKIDAYADYIKKMSGASKEPVDESIEDERGQKTYNELLALEEAGLSSISALEG